MNTNEAYDMVDHQLRNTLDDDQYAEHSEALEVIFNKDKEELDHYTSVLKFLASRPGSGGHPLPSYLVAEEALRKFNR